MWLIKHNIHNNYYRKTLFDNQRHFVSDIDEALRMNLDKAIETLIKFRHRENYTLVEIKTARRR